jgi:hypothetical protein
VPILPAPIVLLRIAHPTRLWSAPFEFDQS